MRKNKNSKSKSNEIVTAGPLGAIQGDVPIRKVAGLTPGGKLTKQRIVAYGETTGHHHQIEGDCDVYEVERSLAGQLFKGFEVHVAEGKTAFLRHNSDGEHNTIALPTGFYFIPAAAGPGAVGQQVEYDGEEERRVAD